MTLHRHDPVRELLRLSDPLLRAFDRDLGELHGNEALDGVSWTPPVDIFEDADGILLKVELPEVDAKEVEINLQGNTLTLRGERKLERAEQKDGYSRIERWSGSFLRSFTLPTSVDVEKITAESKDGVLRISLPKKAETKPRQIPVVATKDAPAKG
jgi:HSP20 family protein